ncbi:MAG: aminoacyltransferase [Anaerolineales bacterium]|nr:aminoacyltransferase [Anaerolineales bacterium]
MIMANEWNKIVASFPTTHVLQTWQWGVVKQQFGWEVLPKIWMDDNEIDAAALVLKRKIYLPIFGTLGAILYVPKGPLLRNWRDRKLVTQVLRNLEKLAKEEKALLVKIDPDVEFARGETDSNWVSCTGALVSHVAAEDSFQGTPFIGSNVVSLLKERGWIFSREQVQFRNTVNLDLRYPEDELLKRMKQKTRYNIRLAEKKGIKIREGGIEDIPLLYQMYRQTSQRDGFIIREESYYKTVWQIYLENLKCSNIRGYTREEDDEVYGVRSEPFAKTLIAEYEGEPVAGLVLFIFRDKAWYMYGMSTDRHREKMPNYLLHWRAIQLLRQIGVKEYDLWGAPDRFEESDPMYGVYRFKIGFGGETVQYIGAWDFPVSRIKYRFYQEVLPRYLRILRLHRRIST